MSDTATATQPSLADRVDALTSNLEKLLTDKEGRRTVPSVRKGEDPMTSRGFQFSRIIGVMSKKLDASQATVEINLAQRIQKEYVERGLYNKHEANNIVVPFSSELMHEAGPDMEKFAGEVGQIVKAGIAGYDPDEGTWVRQKFYAPKRKALSWQDAEGLGTLVPPPEFGEPIELLRNKEVFLSAGARLTPFPASGRAVWPRFTGATSAYWVGSGEHDRSISTSEPTTGDLVLQVRKLGVRVIVPNELFRFPTAAVEAIIRADMALSAALKMDKAFLEGTGSAFEPKGIINYDNINTFTPGVVTADGNRLEPEDILQIIATVEEQNVDFMSWVGRPKLYAGLGNKRADAVTAGDKKGPFLFNILRDGTSASRDVTNYSVGALESYPFHKSNQISKVRAKGGSSDLTYLLGGNFSQYMVAMSGVSEFAVATQGTIFAQDQSEIRMITWCDGGPRHVEAFTWVDNLYQTA